jgi:hypothetical protein
VHRELLQLYDDSVDLRRLLPEQILLKWANYHTKKAGAAKEMTNFGEDFKVTLFDFFHNQLRAEPIFCCY